MGFLNLLDTKGNPNCLFSQREREKERERERERGRSPVVRGRSGGAMVQGKLSVPGVLLIWITVGQRPTALAVGAGRDCLDIFFCLIYLFSFLPLWETVRYRLKYCLKGPLNPKQLPNQIKS